MFKKHFKIIKVERVTGILPYRILERYTILFFIHWWSTPTFAPPHLHQTYKEAYDYIKEMHPNAVIEASLRDPEDVELIQEKTTEDEHWQEVRERAAIAAMQGLLSNSSKVGKIVDYTMSAVDYADALVEQLKKKSQ